MKFKTQIVCILLFSYFSNAYAQKDLTIEKLVHDSGIIITGNVTKIESEWDNSKKNIWTYVTIDCDQYLKGNNNQNDKLIVKIPGGIVGNIGQDVSGTPKFSMNEYVFCFLGKDINGGYYVNGWNQGKFTFNNGKWIRNNSEFSAGVIDYVKNLVNNNK